MRHFYWITKGQEKTAVTLWACAPLKESMGDIAIVWMQYRNNTAAPLELGAPKTSNGTENNSNSNISVLNIGPSTPKWFVNSDQDASMITTRLTKEDQKNNGQIISTIYWPWWLEQNIRKWQVHRIYQQQENHGYWRSE